MIKVVLTTISAVATAAILSILLVTSVRANQDKPLKRSTEDFRQKFEHQITQLYRDYNLQGDFLIGIVDKDGLMYSYSINPQLLNKTRAPLNNDTPFFIASHTKAMTGTLLKILEEEDKLNLDASLHDYLPNLITNDKIDAKAITLRHLLNHTAGFTSIMHTFKSAFLGAMGDDELIGALNHKTLTAPVGEFRYSNTGPIVAGMIVEKVTGNSWQDEIEKRIFAPLKMSMTSSKVSRYPLNSILPAIHTTKEHGVFQKGFYKKDNTMHAAGGTISTINDLAKWLQFNINQDISIIKNKSAFQDLHQATTAQKKTYFTYDRKAYSLAWDIANYQDETLLTRFGGYGGISFHASFMPSQKLGVIAVFNENRAMTLPHLAANYLYNLVLNSESADTAFENEKQLFKADYDYQSKRAFSEEMQIVESEENDKLVGIYTNTNSWPKINIVKLNGRYSFTWGELSGPILKSKGIEKPFIAALGPINRPFRVMKNGGDVETLVNGSLPFTKEP